MPDLTSLQNLLEWVHSVYGAVSTFLIVLVVYQAYLLRRTHREALSARVQLTDMMEKNLRVQRKFVVALTELRHIVERTVDDKGYRRRR